MRLLQQLPIAGIALASLACMPEAPSTTVSPKLGHVRVWKVEQCGSTPTCEERRAGPVYEGPAVRMDSSRLEVFDLNSQTRVAVPADEPFAVEVYRGQRHGADVVAKGAAKGALFGAASGLFSALVLKVAYGENVNLGETARAGIATGVAGGAITGAAQASARGAPAWERVTVQQLFAERVMAARTP